jgi:hypothetical protein
MVYLGYGKYARSDRVYALVPITDERRGNGSRTLVYIEGVRDPVVASRTERSILADMGQGAADAVPLLDSALDLARRLADDAEKVGPLLARSIKAESGVDVSELGRRARTLLESTVPAEEPPPLF